MMLNHTQLHAAKLHYFFEKPKVINVLYHNDRIIFGIRDTFKVFLKYPRTPVLLTQYHVLHFLQQIPVQVLYVSER